jgi:hypothetical protein
MNSRDRDRFEFAQQLFHAGERARATEILIELLPSAGRSDPDAAAAISCLIAESLRGFGDFRRAQRYYEEALATRRHIPAAGQRTGFFAHYGPRAILGLIMVLRRQLSPDHRRIRSLIGEARSDYSQVGQQDFDAQLDVVEALFERQLFHVDAAVSLLDDAAAVVAATKPPYQFIHPDHIAALLSQACLLRSLDRFRAERLAAELLGKADTGAWSRGMASGVLLTLRLSRRLEEGDSSSLAAVVTDDDLFLSLSDAAAAESDPFLTTELCIQQLVCASSRRRLHTAANSLRTLHEGLQISPAPLVLLRAIEVAVLTRGTPDRIDDDVLQQILCQGILALDSISTVLDAYDVDDDAQASWRELLRLSGSNDDTPRTWWQSESLVRLRALAWP